MSEPIYELKKTLSMENLKLTLITLKVKDEIPMELELLERIFTDSLVVKIFLSSSGSTPLNIFEVFRD